MLYVLLLGKGEEPELATQVQMCNSATVTMGSDFQSPNFPLSGADMCRFGFGLFTFC